VKTLYLDCQAGIAGDMTVAALIDLGVPLELLQNELAKLTLPLSAYTLQTENCQRQGIRGLLFNVLAADSQPHRHFGDIKELIAGSGLAAPVKERAQQIFLRLAEAEATVHGVTVDAVHFHEVGAVDSIIDIVATAIALEYLGVESIYASPLPLGSGFVAAAHGLLPVPAPATAELLKGVPVHGHSGSGERVTPTGAAIIAAMANGFGAPPAFRIEKIGYGAGMKDFPDTANILRAFIGSVEPAAGHDQLLVMEANIDDSTPEILGYAMERLFAAGALDVWFTPIQMKKSRPGVTVSLIVPPAAAGMFAEIILTETSAIGLRHYPVTRTVLERNIEERLTPFGTVSFKVTKYGDKPEFDDCRRIAAETGRPLREIYRLLTGRE
jgi:uncharacterized protein (TIGR00299 family) protein